MVTVHCPSHFLSIPSSLSSLAKEPTQQRRIISPFITKQKKPFTSPSQFQTKALNNAVIIATNTSASRGGDISVLIPVSAVLFFMYWIANFVVPDIVQKDLQKKAEEAEEKPDPQINNFGNRNDEENSTGEPRQKLRKADLKKMLRQRQNKPEAEDKERQTSR